MYECMYFKNCLVSDVISWYSFSKIAFGYDVIILGAREVFPALSNMSATGTTSMYIHVSCLQSSINRVIRVIEEEHINAAAIEQALFRVDCLYEAILRLQ